jgi:uncharacterized protein (DUF58 family)
VAGAATVLAVGQVLEALRGVRWPTERPVPGGSAGAHRARTRGTSVEFAEYRSYRQGDDVRRLDWKLLARTDRAYVRLTEDHALLPTTVVVDASASMAFPDQSQAKWRHAALIAIGLAAVAHATGDSVGLRVSGGRSLPPRMRQGVVADIARALADTTPGGTMGIAPVVTDLHGRIAIVSDFLGDVEAVLSLARSARAQGGVVYAVHVVDAEELDPPRRSALVADPEAPLVRRPLGSEARGIYQANFARWRATLADAWRDAGGRYTLTVSGAGGEAAAPTVRRIVSGPPASRSATPTVLHP